MLYIDYIDLVRIVILFYIINSPLLIIYVCLYIYTNFLKSIYRSVFMKMNLHIMIFRIF